MGSIWQKDLPILVNNLKMQDETETEVAIIGGGLAGVLIAYKLQKLGIKCIVLEANKICSGQTLNTTAKITVQHGLCFKRLIEQIGTEKAREYIRAHSVAVEEYRKLIFDRNIDCDYTEADSYVYSTQSKLKMKLEEEAAKRLGLDAYFTKITELPFSVDGAVLVKNQATFNPVKFIKSICKDIKVYEDTKALSVNGNEIITNKGKVYASNIVFACHFPFVNIPGYFFAKMHQERSHVLSLTGAGKMFGMYLSAEKGFSFRGYGDKIIFGGQNHRTGKSKGNFDKLIHFAKLYYPDCEIEAKWSAQDCISADKISYIGRFSESYPNYFAATGFNKWGMTNSMVAADIISAQILGSTDRYGKIFSPSRSKINSLGGITVNGLVSAKGVAKYKLGRIKNSTSTLRDGKAGVFRIYGKKAGVYKKDGKIYVVDIKCPHLGCQLEWNNDEKTWDCPCHGSRFDYKGNILTGPAQNDIK